MDTQAIKKIFSLYDTVVDYENPKTFKEELNRQCSFILVPACIIALLGWIFYIPLDRELFPGLPIIKWLRIGLTVSAAIILILHFTPAFKKLNYALLFSLACYFELAAAVIIGLIISHPQPPPQNATPAYMGGLAMLILILPMFPFRKIHSIVLLVFTIALSAAIGIIFHLKFGESIGDWYGVLNLIAAASVSILAILVLDHIRRVSFEKNQMIHQTNVKLKDSNLEIDERNDELKRANNLKSKLLEIAAHDLKNPLQVIIGNTDLLRMKFVKNPLAMEKLAIIFESGDSMIKLISRLLKALSIDSGKLVLHKRNFNIKRLLESVVKDNRVQAEKKGQIINLSAEEECKIFGDDSVMKDIFDNLLSNAVKFSQPGKSIWVDVNCDDSIVICKVRDEGPGFTESDRKKMFTRFQKLSADPTGDETSTGLGLAIVKELVELHEGKVSVESETGKGSTFIVEFPAVKSQVSSSP